MSNMTPLGLMGNGGLALALALALSLLVLLLERKRLASPSSGRLLERRVVRVE